MANNKDFIVKNAVEVGGSTKTTLGTISGNAIDLSTGNYFSDTLAANTTYTISNAGGVQTFQIEVTGVSLVLNGWDISTAAYNQNFSFSSQASSMRTGFFKPDGTKMYMGSISTNTIYEYNLSTAWDVSTAVYSTNSKSISSQEDAVSGLFFKTDGTKMYLCGKTGDDVNEYNLSTAWDVSTASYSQNFSVSSQETNPSGLFFRTDGLKMYVAGASGDDVNEYTLSTAWDVSTSSYVQNFSFSSRDNDVSGIFFKEDGLKMFHAGDQNNKAYEYTLSTAWDVTTASFVQDFDISSQEQYPKAISFKSDGSKMFVFGEDGNDVSEYNIGSLTAATITWPTSIEWTSSITPSAPDNGKTVIYTIFTDDSGTSYIGTQVGAAPGEATYASSGNSASDGSGSSDATPNQTFTVTVQSVSGSNKYFINGYQQQTITLTEGYTYRFDQSDNSNSGHPLRLSTTSNGTHNSGSEYTTGVTTNGTPGSSGAYTQITVASGAPTLFYYCTNHSGMGGQANTP